MVVFNYFLYLKFHKTNIYKWQNGLMSNNNFFMLVKFMFFLIKFFSKKKWSFCDKITNHCKFLSVLRTKNEIKIKSVKNKNKNRNFSYHNCCLTRSNRMTAINSIRQLFRSLCVIMETFYEMFLCQTHTHKKCFHQR